MCFQSIFDDKVSLMMCLDFRLISESTVEESIYGKANQKRFLGHLAIESGGFTTAVLKKVGSL